MAKPLRILDAAADETHDAWMHYMQNSDRAAGRFQEAVEKAIAEIQDDPDRWPEYLFGTQYFQLKKFPSLIVYRETAEEIQIIAVAHGRRRPGYWKKRTS